MSSIDQRIVEMQFDNAQFERGISSSLKSLDSLKKKLNLDREADSLSNLQKTGKNFNLSGLASNIEFVASKFSAFGILGVTAMHRISNAAISAGKDLVSSLTIDPVKSGLSEYETQINAIQTILSNTRSKGSTIDDVNEALDTLNTYADKTIYNFTEMTRNIGTFTAAGVDLNTSTSAIKGIANLAAVSGSTSQQASTAMYQLSQALAAGTIRLMDWNSLVNAGMGGEVLQNALKETARAHGIAIDNIIDKQGSFRESLQEGWLSSKIMLETLQKFTGDLTKEQILEMGYTEKQAEEIIALGKDANDAATKVKTFTQLIDTLKEALQSGWTQSWEYVIGNFEEAREFWTSVSDAIGSVIGKNAEARNELLKGWYEAGGRTDLIAGVKDTFSALYGIVVAISEAMHEVFPETTADDLLNISSKVKEFGANLKAVLQYRKELKSVGLDWTKESSSIPPFIEELKKGIKGDDVKKLQEQLKSLGYDLGQAGVDGIFGPKTEAALKQFQEKMGLAVDGVFKSTDHEALFSGEEVTKYSVVAEYVYKFSDALEKVKHIAKGAFSALSVGVRVLGFLGKAALTVLGVFKPIGSAIVSVAMAISDCFINLDESLKVSTKFSEWISQLQTYLAPLATDMESAKQAILDFFGVGDAVDETPDKIDTFIELWTKLKEVAGENIPKAKAAIGTFLSGIYGNVRAFALKVPEFIGSIVDFFVGLYEQIKNSEKFQAKYKSVVEFLTNIKNSISEFFTVIQTAFSDFFSKDTTDAKTFGEQIKERFSVFISVGEWISSAWYKLSGFIKSVYNSVSDLAGTLGTGGLLMLIGGIFIGVKVLKAVYNISNFAKNVTSAISDISKSLKIDKKAKRLVEVRNVILSLALVIGTLVAAVYLIGKMDTGELKQGAIVVGSLVGGLIALATAATLIGSKAKYFKSIKNAGKGIFQFAAAIGILAASMIVLGHIEWKTFWSGAGKLALIAGLLGTFMIVMNKFGGSGFKSTGLLAVVGAIGILSLIARLIGGMDTEKLWRGIARVTAIAVILGTFAIVVNKLGGSSIKTIGLLGIAAAIGILGVIATMLAVLPRETLMKGILSIGGIALVLVGTAAALNLLTKSLNIGASLVALAGFGLILVAFGYVLDKVRDIDPTVMITFAATLAISLASVFSLLAGAGVLAAPVTTGAIVIGAIATAASIIIGVLGAIDEHWTKGGILSAMQRGGEIMQAVGEAIGKFFAGIGSALINGLSESAGEALTTFGESVNTFTEKISGISASESMSSDIEAVISVATAMAGFFDGLGGITLNLSGLSMFNSGTENLAIDMGIFGTAISDFGSAVSNMAEGTFVDDTSAALSAATSIRDFLDGISGLDIEKNKGAIAKWLTGDTKTGSLFSQMTTLGESISSLNTNFGGLSQNGFAENVETVRTSMESLTGLLTWLGNDENKVDTSGAFYTSNFAKVLGQMDSMAQAVSDFNSSTAEVDTTRFASIISAVQGISQSLATITADVSSDSISTLTTAIGEITSAMSSAGSELASAITEGVSSAKVDTSGMTIICDGLLTAVTDYLDEFGLSGSQIAESVANGVGTAKISTTGIKTICSEMLSVANRYQDNFSTAGYNMGKGLSKGMSMSRSIVVNSAKAVAQAALSAAKNVLGIASPSKEYAKVGRYSNEGFAEGLLGYAGVVTAAASEVGYSAMSATRNTIAGLSAAIASDIDTNPVIRPVMDLSDVASGAKTIDGLLSTGGSVSINAARSAAIASSVSASTRRMNQNGETTTTSQISNNYDQGINFSDSTFYIRSEEDIRSLASEIAALTYNQQRSLGAL